MRSAVGFVSLPTLILCSGLVGFMLAYPRDAHAYLDAGTGSMLLQAAIASAVAAAFLAKSYWRRLVVALTGRSSAGDDEKQESRAADESK